MKKGKKALLLVACALLLVAGSVLGTLAYLTSTDSVTNTFTVGKVAITLDETKVNKDGTAVEGADRVDANEYHLLPGHTYVKDPTIHVDAASEDCWLFVKVVDEIAAIQDTATVAAQLKTNGWTLVEGTTNVYARATTNKANDDVKVFENFKIKGDVTNETLAAYAPTPAAEEGGEATSKTITVTAYAVQADGFTTAAAAWNAAGLN